jgi:hypothetical protein
MSILKGAAKKTGSNYNPFNFAYLVERDDVDTVPAPTRAFVTAGAATFRIATDIELLATKVFVGIDLNKAGCKLVETKVEGDSEYYDCTATGFYPELDENATAVASTFVGVEGVAILVNIDGTRRVMGSKENPCKVTKFDLDTAKGGYDLEIKWQGTTPCPFYPGAITV